MVISKIAEFWIFVLSYTAVMLISWGIIAWFQRGFFFAWLKVKTSAGRKVLVKIRGMVRDYYKAGEIIEGFLIYKIQGSKDKRRIVIAEDCLYRTFQVVCVDVDETKNAVMKRDYSAVTGHDAEKQSDYIERALKKPVLFNIEQYLKIIMIVCIIIGIIALLSVFLQYQNGVAIKKVWSDVIIIKNIFAMNVTRAVPPNVIPLT